MQIDRRGKEVGDAATPTRPPVKRGSGRGLPSVLEVVVLFDHDPELFTASHGGGGRPRSLSLSISLCSSPRSPLRWLGGRSLPRRPRPSSARGPRGAVSRGGLADAKTARPAPPRLAQASPVQPPVERPRCGSCAILFDPPPPLPPSVPPSPSSHHPSCLTSVYAGTPTPYPLPSMHSPADALTRGPPLCRPDTRPLAARGSRPSSGSDQAAAPRLLGLAAGPNR